MTAIIPDVHENVNQLKEILSFLDKMNIKNKVFLGDWFDTFRPSDVLEISKLLKKLLQDENSVFLFGNHDVPYAFGPKLYPCPGFTWDKNIAINNHLHKEWSKFKLAHKVGKFWCSHAGIHPTFAHPIHGLSDEYIIQKTDQALYEAKRNISNPWMNWGADRGGDLQKYGGITWLDFSSSFVPIDGLNQIVGHSINWMPRRIYTETSDNFCIDTQLDTILIVDENTSELKMYLYDGLEVDMDSTYLIKIPYKTDMDKIRILGRG